MKLSSFKKSIKKFHYFQWEKNRRLAFFFLPAIWKENNHHGLEVHTSRFTLCFLRYRCHWYFGKITPMPNQPFESPIYGLNSFIKWAALWSKKPFSSKDFNIWLAQSDWKILVRWGGAKYHYSKIILAQEFLSRDVVLSNPILSSDF